MAYDALSVGAFVSERENKNHAANKTIEDEMGASWNVKYSAGPVSVGYSEFVFDSGLATSGATDTTAAKTVGTTDGMWDGDMFSIAFNVNDDLSISYSEMTATYDSRGHQADGVKQELDVDEKHESLQLAYSMGAMSVKAYTTEITNPNFDEDAATVTKNEIALGLSF